jgi:thiamine biosynthesis lipoprotein
MRLALVLSLSALLSLAAHVAVAVAVPAPPADHVVERTHECMGTIIVLKVWAEDDARVVKDYAEVFAEFDRVDALMTTWTPDSEVSRVNAGAGGPGVVVSPELFGLLEKARAASALTRGAFDVTVGVYAGIWKFDEDNDGTLPDPALVKARHRLVDWRGMTLDAKTRRVRLRKGQKITLGGLAKGYAVDRATAMLRARGYPDFVVQAGGDMYVSGRRGDRRWRVGIRDPRGDRSDFFAAAEVEDATFSTSGDYERFVIKDGKRYHHILDPRTGFPAAGVRSVTVKAKDATTAEGLTKGVFVLGWRQGLALCKKAGVEVVIVDSKNQVHVSPGLAGNLQIVHPPTDAI